MGHFPSFALQVLMWWIVLIIYLHFYFLIFAIICLDNFLEVRFMGQRVNKNVIFLDTENFLPLGLYHFPFLRAIQESTNFSTTLTTEYVIQLLDFYKSDGWKMVLLVYKFRCISLIMREIEQGPFAFPFLIILYS